MFKGVKMRLTGTDHNLGNALKICLVIILMLTAGCATFEPAEREKTVGITLETELVSCESIEAAHFIIRAYERDRHYPERKAGAVSQMLMQAIGACEKKVQKVRLTKVVIDSFCCYVYLAEIDGIESYIPSELDFTDD
jgi:hypothetical protein